MALGTTRDRWAEWLSERRFGGDVEVRERMLGRLAQVRDEVLDRAHLREGDTLLDVGCGEGLIGFGALARGAGTVIFSDISTDLLDFCRQAATDLDVLDRCRFVNASAEDLARIDDESVEVVTTRSVLIYVPDKAAAFGEFARVLRPGGRLSLFEPVNRFGSQERWSGRFAGYRLDGLEEVGAKLFALFDSLQPRETDPMLDFDERDLLRLAETAGFFPISLRLDAVVEHQPPRSWESFLEASGNPNIPTLREAMEQVLTPDERDLLAGRLRPLVENGTGEWRMAHPYVAATNPKAGPRR